ncbi:hypothetical protein BN1708_014550 [Verticillium longisporum]|uniref:Transcription factor domain-containing protein n=1 Tax=Verticillium longisporum TaxID=100787 RepID=A0A0G4LWY7_VERLO|nr:hypothetical protein BN1708_014550 [Verticillium longisporum]
MLAVLDIVMTDEPTSDGDFWRTQETSQIYKSSEIRPKSFSGLMDPAALKGKRLAVRPFYAPLDDPCKHTEAGNRVRYADMIDYIRHSPESIHDLPECVEALHSLEVARKQDLGSGLDEHGCDAVVFPTNGDVPRADAEEVVSSMQHALRDGVKYSNGTRALKHMSVPAIKVRAAQTRGLEAANERPACDEESTTLQKEAGAITPHLLLPDDPLSVDFPFSDDLATFLGLVPDSEDSTRKHLAPSYEESELLMYYLDRIFPMQYTHYSNRKWGRGWLFWLLNKNGPLYKAALSLAALHKHSLMCAVNEDLRHNDVLLEYHTSALRGLQDFIGQPQGDAISKDDEDFIEVIACGLALISFEVFRGGKGDWQPHLQATTAIMKTMNLSRLVFHASGRIESFISSSARERRGIDAALSFHAPVLLWMDLLACASTGNVPFLPYETWLQMEGFDMTKIMGCQNWVMKAIGDLAVLEERKVSLKGQTEVALLDWIRRARKIKNELEAGTEGLDL